MIILAVLLFKPHGLFRSAERTAEGESVLEYGIYLGRGYFTSLSDYGVHLLILVGIYLILAQAFNVNFGLGRLFNLAHVASYAIGAYTTALLATNESIQAQFPVCIAASMALAGVFAFSIGAISLKLAADYFAIGTLAFSAVVSALLINWKSLTRGVLGIPGIPRPEMFAIDFNENRNFLALMIVIVLAATGILYLIFRGPYARSLRAQAESSGRRRRSPRIPCCTAI